MNNPVLVSESKDHFQHQTKRAFLWMSLAHEPFLAIYTLIPFILRNDLNATVLQLSILSTLRPFLTILAFYWSAYFRGGGIKLRSNLMLTWTLARAPFLLVPWISNSWYILACCASYELFNKSGIPSLMEILKINMKSYQLNKTYTICFVLSFLESIFLGFILAQGLDSPFFSWKLILMLSTLLSLSSVIFQSRLTVPSQKDFENDSHNILLSPWKKAFKLLKENADFARFQKGFMIGGFALMMTAPTLCVFYVDVLKLTHAEVISARSIIMAIGISASAYLWRKVLKKEKIDQVTSLILFGFFFYLVLMIFSQFNRDFFFLSFFVYGITQSGSHLLWNLSGPIFAGDQSSTPYSRVNILMVGLRGCIAPLLGGVLCKFLGPVFVLGFSALICFIGCIFVLNSSFKKSVNQEQASS